MFWKLLIYHWGFPADFPLTESRILDAKTMRSMSSTDRHTITNKTMCMQRKNTNRLNIYALWLTGSVHACKGMFIPKQYVIVIIHIHNRYPSIPLCCRCLRSNSMYKVSSITQLEAYNLSLLRLLLPAGEFGAWIVMLVHADQHLTGISRLTLAAFWRHSIGFPIGFSSGSHISRQSPKSCPSHFR